MPLSTLISNLIILAAGLGILILFLRKLPEALQTKEQNKPDSSALVTNFSQTLAAKASGQQQSLHRETAEAPVVNFFSGAAKKAWHFVLEAKDFKQGQALASKFAQIMPSKKAFNIATLSTLKKAEKLFEQNDLDEAERIYFSIIKKHPHEYKAYEGLLDIYQQQKNYQQVQELLEYLVSHNPQNDNYYSQLGNILMKRRKFKEAIVAYNTALAINNLVPARFVNIGLCYQSLKEFPKAAENLQKALDLEPENVQYWMMLAEVLGKLGEEERAKAVLEKAIKLKPQNKQTKEKLLKN
jgi:tetratricopeptide (TPR) repeat protein